MAVSAPREKSEPGTLLEMVQGITTTGMLRQECWALALSSWQAEVKAWWGAGGDKWESIFLTRMVVNMKYTLQELSHLFKEISFETFIAF